jgi:hypothetical protein
MICYIPGCICYGSKNFGLGSLHDDYGPTLKGDSKVKTVVTRWLVAQDMVFYQPVMEERVPCNIFPNCGRYYVENVWKRGTSKTERFSLQMALKHPQYVNLFYDRLS